VENYFDLVTGPSNSAADFSYNLNQQVPRVPSSSCRLRKGSTSILIFVRATSVHHSSSKTLDYQETLQLAQANKESMSARLDSLLLAVLALLWCAKFVAGNECPSDDPAYPNAYKPLGQLTFYWKMDATTLNGKLVYDGTGYIAVGPSPNAKMSGGEVVLGLPNSGTVQSPADCRISRVFIYSFPAVLREIVTPPLKTRNIFWPLCFDIRETTLKRADLQ